MTIIHIIKKNTTEKSEVLHNTVPTTEVSLSQTTPESHTQSLNQSALLSSQDDGTAGSSFPIAAVIVSLLVVVGICVFLLLGYIFRKKIKAWMCRRFGEPRTDIELTTMTEQTPETADHSERDPDVSSTDQDSKVSQANISFAPLLGPGNSDV